MLSTVVLWLWVALGGALGAVSRYLTVTYVQKLAGIAFPIGTMTVNVLGSFIIGLFLEYVLKHFLPNPQAKALFVVGFLGAFTTFSSFSYESVALLIEKEWLKAAVYIFGTNILCLTATILGVVVGRVLPI